MRWPTWVWAFGVWVWMALAVSRSDGGSGMGLAQAALGGAGDGLLPTRDRPLPAWQSEPLTDRPGPEVSEADQIKHLSQRSDRWESLRAPVREALDLAVERPGNRAPWRRVVVEGTGEAEGSARDLVFVNHRRGQTEADGFRSAHFFIGNGTRSGDGAVEETGRPLRGEALVVALVGNFPRNAPTEAQLRALTELVDYARAKTGVIPVVAGEAARTPVSAAVLRIAFGPEVARDLVDASRRN